MAPILCLGHPYIWCTTVCHDTLQFVAVLTVVTVGFERRIYIVDEGDGQVELCVIITVPRRQDIGTVTFILIVVTQNGSAGKTLQTEVKWFHFKFCSRKFSKHVHIL